MFVKSMLNLFSQLFCDHKHYIFKDDKQRAVLEIRCMDCNTCLEARPYAPLPQRRTK